MRFKFVSGGDRICCARSRNMFVPIPGLFFWEIKERIESSLEQNENRDLLDSCCAKVSPEFRSCAIWDSVSKYVRGVLVSLVPMVNLSPSHE